MAPPSTLLGPPEIHLPSESSPPTTQSTGNPLMDLMLANFNSIQLPQMGLTENSSPTFLSTGNPCLDFFFHILPTTLPSSITQRLHLAWTHNPLTALKLICNLRGVRGTGKSDRESYYTAALWLHNHHPKTLASNVASLADFGYFKDLPEILYRLLQGPDVRLKAKAERMTRKRRRTTKRTHLKRGSRSISTREARISAEKKRAEGEREKAARLREERRISMAKKVVERYNRDPDFKFLHDRISDHFADCLKLDIGFLNSGELRKISLAAKWCPSLDSSFDRSTLLCESIARKVFPYSNEYEGIEDAHYAYRVRDRLRKEILVPLRKALELPEVYIGANQWNLIPYNRVASVAMKLYKQKFRKHDGERFSQYLENVRSGKTTIAAGALMPHGIIASLYDGDGGEVAELQWRRMVDDLGKKGKMKNCLAVCDVSGSMEGVPMEVSVALGLLVSELSEEPWKGKVITFSHNPSLQVVGGDDLRSKTEFVRNMEWGRNTDFQKVFDLILQVAVNGNLREEEMIKRVFVFSDMEFDQASGNQARTRQLGGRGYASSGNRWETDYEAIRRKFVERGYGSSVPEIVFWNLRNSKATPVPGREKGVALVSGYSKNLMTLFLEEGGVINPEAAMEFAISGDEYTKLVVVD